MVTINQNRIFMMNDIIDITVESKKKKPKKLELEQKGEKEKTITRYGIHMCYTFQVLSRRQWFPQKNWFYQ